MGWALGPDCSGKGPVKNSADSRRVNEFLDQLLRFWKKREQALSPETGCAVDTKETTNRETEDA
jgi:hypothetical protein